MHATVINKYGDTDVLEYKEDVSKPECAPNQVLIKIKAASINPLDWKTRRGDLRFLLKSHFPMILGSDVSGTIVEVGNEVEGFAIADDVFCMLDANIKSSMNGFAKSGGYAEYAITRADTLCIKPTCLSHIEAAAVPLAALTAYQALVHMANIQTGQSVLINGASGGVGIFAVQIAKAFGAHVTAVCSKENKSLLIRLGADTVLDYRKTDFKKQNQSYDIIYDVVSNRSFNECRPVLNKTGIFISNVPNFYSFMSTLLRPLMRFFGPRQKCYHAWVQPKAEDLKAISLLIDQQQIEPVIGAVFSKQNIKLAHEASEKNQSHGKIVINMETLT